MSEPYLTMAEIEAKYPNQWVLIDQVKHRKGYQDLLGGRVLWHAADRDEFDRRLFDFPEMGDCAVLYMGKPDPDFVYMLNSEL